MEIPDEEADTMLERGESLVLTLCLELGKELLSLPGKRAAARRVLVANGAGKSGFLCVVCGAPGKPGKNNEKDEHEKN
jgi:hypothetical protein